MLLILASMCSDILCSVLSAKLGRRIVALLFSSVFPLFYNFILISIEPFQAVVLAFDQLSSLLSSLVYSPLIVSLQLSSLVFSYGLYDLICSLSLYSILRSIVCNSSVAVFCYAFLSFFRYARFIALVSDFLSQSDISRQQKETWLKKNQFETGTS